MSLSGIEEVKCPCGDIFEAKLWSALNVVDDPELKEFLLAGEINVVRCQKCNQIFYVEQFILYIDNSNDLLAFVYPSSCASLKNEYNLRMQEDFMRIKNAGCSLSYEPILLFGLDALVELVRKEEAETDEITILEYEAPQLGLSLISLSPTAARKAGLPRLLPSLHVKNCNVRDEIIEGLRCLLSANENLENYQKLLQLIENDKNWILDKAMIVG